MNQQTKFYGLVLIGGKSSRMKTDKALLEFHGQSQALYLSRLLNGFCERVFLSKRSDQELTGELNSLPYINDSEEFSGIGPLGGILSALSQSPHCPWIVLACDLPLVDPQTIKTLIQKRNPQKVATAFKSSFDGLPEPLCAIYEPQALQPMLAFLKSGVQCPRKILIGSSAELLDQSHPAKLANINTPEDFQNALSLVQSQVQEKSVKTVHIQYFAILREQRGLGKETILTCASTPRSLYDELIKKFPLKFSREHLKVAVNGEYAGWDQSLKQDDIVAFLPPVAGG